MANETIGDIMEALWSLPYQCTCCGQPARHQCEDHDDGYGVCDACLAKYGREEFCKIASCAAHELPEGK